MYSFEKLFSSVRIDRCEQPNSRLANSRLANSRLTVNRSAAGMTLVEMVIAIAIFSLLLTNVYVVTSIMTRRSISSYRNFNSQSYVLQSLNPLISALTYTTVDAKGSQFVDSSLSNSVTCPNGVTFETVNEEGPYSSPVFVYAGLVPLVFTSGTHAGSAIANYYDLVVIAGPQIAGVPNTCPSFYMGLNNTTLNAVDGYGGGNYIQLANIPYVYYNPPCSSITSSLNTTISDSPIILPTGSYPGGCDPNPATPYSSPTLYTPPIFSYFCPGSQLQYPTSSCNSYTDIASVNINVTVKQIPNAAPATTPPSNVATLPVRIYGKSVTVNTAVYLLNYASQKASQVPGECYTPYVLNPSRPLASSPLSGLPSTSFTTAGGYPPPPGSALFAYWYLYDSHNTSAEDYSGNANTGALYGSTHGALIRDPNGPLPCDTSAPAIKLQGGSGSFTGHSGYVSIPLMENYSPTQFTVEAWFKPSSATFPAAIVANGSPNSGSSGGCYTPGNPYGEGFLLQLNSSNQISFSAGGGETWNNSSFCFQPSEFSITATGGSITPGEWYFIAATYQAKSTGTSLSVQLYNSTSPSPIVVAGQNFSGTASPVPPTGLPITIGGIPNISGFPSSSFLGSVGQVAIYNSSLMPDQFNNQWCAAMGSTYLGGGC